VQERSEVQARLHFPEEKLEEPLTQTNPVSQMDALEELEALQVEPSFAADFPTQSPRIHFLLEPVQSLSTEQGRRQTSSSSELT
jgi:hypothetical protein